MKDYLFSYINRKKYILALCDGLVIMAAIFLSYFIRVYISTGQPSLELVVNKLSYWHLFIVAAHLMSLYIFDLYDSVRLISPFKTAIKIIISIFCTAALISGIFFFFPKYIFGRQILIYHILLLSGLLILWRLIAFKANYFWGKNKRLSIICNSGIAKELVSELREHLSGKMELSSICILQNTNNEIKECLYVDKHRIYNSLDELFQDNQFDILIFDSSNGQLPDRDIRRILELKHKGKKVYDFPVFYKSLTGKIPLEYIDGRWLLNSEYMQGYISNRYEKMKRIIDIFVSGITIVLLSPFCLLIAILIKLESKGPLLYKQERLGKNRKPFICYKFRTMFENAESKSGPVWAEQNDTRITRLGMILRKSRLDEIPQLWNILKGDISFVGPRPIRKYFADQFAEKTPFYELRYSIKPGLSGWAQIHGCFAVPYGYETLKYELFYIQHMSFFLDIITILKTIRYFFKVCGR